MGHASTTKLDSTISLVVLVAVGGDLGSESVKLYVIYLQVITCPLPSRQREWMTM